MPVFARIRNDIPQELEFHNSRPSDTEQDKYLPLVDPGQPPGVNALFSFIVDWPGDACRKVYVVQPE